MAENSIYSLLNNTNIGNGDIYNLTEYVNSMNPSPGIKTYTQDRHFLENNITNNYNTGKNGRYGYGGGQSSILNPFGFNKIYGTDSVKMENGRLVQANLTQDRVGEFYTVNPDSTNSTLKFMSEYEFGDMSYMLMSGLLTKNLSEYDLMRRYFDNYDKFIVSGMPIISMPGGEIVNTVYHNEYERFFFDKQPLLVSNIDNRFNLLRYRSDKPYHDELGFTGSQYGDEIELTTQINNSWGLKDLLSYYDYERNKLLSTTLLGFPYGVKREEIEYYSINQKNTYTGTTLNPDISNGKLITPQDNGNITYSYYEEVDGNTPSRISDAGSSTPSNFIPLTDNFSSSSRLLQRTNELFRTAKIGSLVNRFHTDVVEPSDLITSYSKYGLSRGRNLLRANNESDNNTGYHNPYCRVWTAAHQYAKMKNLIRPFDGEYSTIQSVHKGLGKLRTDDGAEHLYNNTVLQDSGFVRISTQHDQNGNFEFEKNGTNLTRYMFSIENLAWKNSDEYTKLPIEQKGPNGGRIMWFPPYNLSFNENTNVSWHNNEFIGRGEKIYTYTNTERSGNLDFTILIDHPSVIDRWRGSGVEIDYDKNEAQDDLLRFFAGCAAEPVLTKEMEEVEKPKEEETIDDDIPSIEPEMDTSDSLTFVYYLFFPNNFSGVDYAGDPEKLLEILSGTTDTAGYEFTSNGDPFYLEDGQFEPQILRPENETNYSLFGLNATTGFSQHVSEIKTLIGSNIITESSYDSDERNQSFQSMAFYLPKIITTGKVNNYDGDYEIDSIDVYGFASSHGYGNSNKILFKNRQNTMINLIQYLTNNHFNTNDFVTEGKTSEIKVKGVDVNTLDAKIARSAAAVFHLKLKSDTKAPNITNIASGLQITGATPDIAESRNITRRIQNELVKKDTTKKYKANVSDEYLYFSQIESENEFVYKNIVDKIRFFDPAFHSITPEGFNGRLSFLQQCTRQGPTRERNSGGGQAWNLAFGMQPYCILRIGDFYHSKIVITSLSVSYDNDGVRWDLNPEGAGVQPMMAKVTMSFNFVGGQDLGGPVNELQNAITENYYANTSIFNSRAKKIKNKLD